MALNDCSLPRHSKTLPAQHFIGAECLIFSRTDSKAVDSAPPSLKHKKWGRPRGRPSK
jgi:hypothetical protein